MERRLKETRIEGTLEACEIRELPVIREGNYGSPGLAILSIKNGHILLAPFFGRIGYEDAVRMVKGRQGVCLKQEIEGYHWPFVETRTLSQHLNEEGGAGLPLHIAYNVLEKYHLRINNEGFIEPDSLNPLPLPKKEYYNMKRITPIKRENYLFLISNL